MGGSFSSREAGVVRREPIAPEAATRNPKHPDEVSRMTAPPAVADAGGVASHARVERAFSIIRESDADTIADMRAVVGIAAPTFEEHERASWMRGGFRASGLNDVDIDAVGNVIAHLSGSRLDLAPVLIAAHLDTVFARSVDLSIRESDARIGAPGIADNARGLAAMLAIARALIGAGVVPKHPIVFAATVGEEGIGDLRGVKHLFRERGPFRDAAGFIALDGTGIRRIVHRAVGSRRLRVRVTGPGGHSWADRGAPNPIHVLAEAAARIARAAPPADQAAALNIGRIGGGTSVNAIAEEAWLEIDLRAEDAADLAGLERLVHHVLNDIVEAANASRRPRTGALVMNIELLGDRPSGTTPIASPIVAAARAATRQIGARPELTAASTDANVPIALGIPAIALGAGGESGRTHTTDEWFSNERGPEGIQRALLTLIAAAGIDPG